MHDAGSTSPCIQCPRFKSFVLWLTTLPVISFYEASSWRHSDVSRGGVSNWLAVHGRVGWSVCCSVCWTSLTNRRTVWTLRVTVCPTVCATVGWRKRYGRLLDKRSVQLSHVVFTLCDCCTDSLSNSRILWTAYKCKGERPVVSRSVACRFQIIVVFRVEIFVFKF